MSPRRSSRARTTQPTPSIPQQSNSSSSSISSGRAPLKSQSNQGPPSQRSSVTARSQSSEDPDGTPKPKVRRTRSSQEVVKDEATHAIEDEIEDEADEEVTRCICGHQEYPGLPVTSNDSSKGSTKGDTNSAAFAEDATGWFIQCDGCKVWQHGGCVGLMDQNTSPEEYFCEQCRKDSHKITIAANGYVNTSCFQGSTDKIEIVGNTQPTFPAKKPTLLSPRQHPHPKTIRRSPEKAERLK